ncbi:MAG: DNA-directed RNA polymerase subunit alpha, partial [Pseudonocardiaceae bacterium]
LKLATLGLQLKDSPPGFDLSAAAAAEYSADGWDEASENGTDNCDNGDDYAETEQL